MAKGQKRSAKEQRKTKSGEKKPDGPKYLRATEPIGIGKLAAQRPSRMK